MDLDEPTGAALPSAKKQELGEPTETAAKEVDAGEEPTETAAPAMSPSALPVKQEAGPVKQEPGQQAASEPLPGGEPPGGGPPPQSASSSSQDPSRVLVLQQLLNVAGQLLRPEQP